MASGLTDVSPRFSAGSAANGHLADAQFGCNVFLHDSFSDSAADVAHKVIREPGLMIGLATSDQFRVETPRVTIASHSSFRINTPRMTIARCQQALPCGVPNIVGVSSEPKMVGIDAPLDIATVTNEQPPGDRPFVEVVGETVRLGALAGTNVETAVLLADRRDPLPATRRDTNVLPESLKKRWSGILAGRHRSLLLRCLTSRVVTATPGHFRVSIIP